MIKKLSLLLLSTCIPLSSVALNCSQLTGLWQGQYQDTQGLFPKRSFPVNLMLQVQGNTVYGYTLPAKDQTGAGYGINPPAYFWATCNKGVVSNLYLIHSNDVCTAPQTNPNLTLKNDALTFNSHWQNAMIDTVFYFSLKRATMHVSLNKQWITHAEAAANKPLPTCH